MMTLSKRATVGLVIAAFIAGAAQWGALGSPTTAYRLRQLAEAALRRGEYQKASGLFLKESEEHRLYGDLNAAKVERDKAYRWSTEIAVYREVVAQPGKAGPTRAKHEPEYGCYLGAFVERDDNLDNMDEGYHPVRAVAFGNLIGKRPATAFTYLNYGNPFPSTWAKQLTENGIAPHIAWEPNAGLDAVQDNAYLRAFAKAAAECKGPVFVRFAGEMNGKWTRYHGNPALYREKFRLVSRVLGQLAPNAVMIWCVNTVPEHNIDEYYPGDQYVDWVGVNFYSVYYHDNDKSRPASHENPIVNLRYVYDRYSSGKPIAICEYGASHEDTVDGVVRPGFAATKLAMLYSALPRLFPRVKMVDIFDCNNLKHAVPSRRLNNYSVTDEPKVLEAFREAVRPDYFLAGGSAAPPATMIEGLREGALLSGRVALSSWAKTYEDNPTVAYLLDGKELHRSNAPGTYPFGLDTDGYAPGRHVLSVRIIDSKGRLAGKRDTTVVFGAKGK